MKTSILNITISNEKVNNSTGKKKSNNNCSWGLCKSDTKYAEKISQIRFCYTEKSNYQPYTCMHMTHVRLMYLHFNLTLTRAIKTSSNC